MNIHAVPFELLSLLIVLSDFSFLSKREQSPENPIVESRVKRLRKDKVE